MRWVSRSTTSAWSFSREKTDVRDDGPWSSMTLLQATRDSPIPLQESGDCLVVPLPANPDSDGVGTMCKAVLGLAHERRPAGVVFDCTGTRLLDSRIADSLNAVARPLALLGATVVVAGLSPALSSALVRLDVALDDLLKARDLDHAFDLVAQRKGGYR